MIDKTVRALYNIVVKWINLISCGRRMFMPRFFVDRENVDVENGKIILSGDDAHHIARSLRMAEGEMVTVCDGEGTDYVCRLDRIRDTESVCTIVESAASLSEPPYSVLVCQALVKGERMDIAAQKSVEFGAAHILPFESSRCIVRMKDGGKNCVKDGGKNGGKNGGGKDESKSADNKLIRLRRITAEAAKQCGRGRLPQVEQCVDFADMLKRASGADMPLFCYEDEHTRMLGSYLEEWRTSGKTPGSIAVVVGPEGGFSPEEAHMAEEAGLIPISLGRRILRTESAAAFVLACLSVTFELN